MASDYIRSLAELSGSSSPEKPVREKAYRKDSERKRMMLKTTKGRMRIGC